jgi:hypothetical protein
VKKYSADYPETLILSRPNHFAYNKSRLQEVFDSYHSQGTLNPSNLPALVADARSLCFNWVLFALFDPIVSFEVFNARVPLNPWTTSRLTRTVSRSPTPLELKQLRMDSKTNAYFDKFCFHSLCFNVVICFKKPVTKVIPYSLSRKRYLRNMTFETWQIYTYQTPRCHVSLSSSSSARQSRVITGLPFTDSQTNIFFLSWVIDPTPTPRGPGGSMFFCPDFLP